ncbi:galactose oxidase early set domain-containing protein [Actinocorallia sp. B10E7]|uniref:galactose oxidase early set domain-containing protein n=1 Tax=Actinocorallia sp. B10E7 TaxID=3153558 RepID=UPI00325ECBDA
MRFRRTRVRAFLAGSTMTMMTAVLVQGGVPAHAAANLAPNPKLETVAGRLPQCWEVKATGRNTGSAKIVTGRGGKRAMQITQTMRVSGWRALVQTRSCAIKKVKAGQRLDLSFLMKSTTPKMSVMFFRQKSDGTWVRWSDHGVGDANDTWHRATVRTGPVPEGTKAVRFGLAISGKGVIATDDYVLTASAARPAKCTNAVACVEGRWRYVSFGDAAPDDGDNDANGYTNPGDQDDEVVKKGVRAMHTVVLRNGKVLLIAGSGNNPKNFNPKGFESLLYDPVTGRYKKIKTPTDMFCAGHVQLPDGRVLIMGGTKKYPSYIQGQSEAYRGWKGEDKSYVFDPNDNKYHQTNNTRDGHWYPSATILGNGDVYSVGGYSDDYTKDGYQRVSRVSEKFKYKKNSKAGGYWLPRRKVKQTPGVNWSTYPSLILMQNGRLFYSGSSVFGHPVKGGDDESNYDHDAKAFIGPGIFNHEKGTYKKVRGLTQPWARDQSASVLLPPAQRQKVMIMGGMDFSKQGPGVAHAHTDIVDLKAGSPRYRRGPDLNAAKVYVSTVLLPDGKVFETGGSLMERKQYVKEAAMFDPKRPNAWERMAPDKIGRTYHNTAVLLPDGRVLAAGSNPASNFYETRLSIYSPPYFFKGPRPRIKSVKKYWAYGATYDIKTNRKIKSAWLMRPGAVTHSSDPNQRAVAPEKLKISGNTSRFKLTNNPNIAPPGWYMLFATDANGVPSVAKWVHIG